MPRITPGMTVQVERDFHPPEKTPLRPIPFPCNPLPRRRTNGPWNPNTALIPLHTRKASERAGDPFQGTADRRFGHIRAHRANRKRVAGVTFNDPPPPLRLALPLSRLTASPAAVPPWSSA